MRRLRTTRVGLITRALVLLAAAVMSVGGAPAAAADTHDLEFRIRVPASQDTGSCDAETIAGLLSLGQALELRTDTGATVSTGTPAEVVAAPVDGMCEVRVVFPGVPDAEVYYLVAGGEVIAARAKLELEASDWTATIVYGAVPEPSPIPDTTPAPTAPHEYAIGEPIPMASADGVDPDDPSLPGGTYTVLRVEPWQGNRFAQPRCEGCTLLTAEVLFEMPEADGTSPALKQPDETGWTGGIQCVSADGIMAVGTDGTEVTGERWGYSRRPTFGMKCLGPGASHQGWILFRLPPGFELDYLRVQTFEPGVEAVVRP